MEQTIAVPTITAELVTGTLNVELTKAQVNLQKLSDAEAKLIYNEDGLPKIQALLEDGRRAKKTVESIRATMKDPYLKTGQMIDKAARDLNDQIDAILRIPTEKNAAMCRDIEKRAREAEQERQRKQQILAGIDANMVSFSQQITNCNTDKELTAVERMINLEKANKKKYAEFYEQAAEKFSTLTSLLALQKERIREAKELEAKRLKAEKKGDDAAILALNEKQVALESRIEEAKVTVQEAAISQSLATGVIEATEIIPEIKTRHRMWTWEISDINKTVKSMPSWTKIETVDEKINEFMKASKDSWVESGKEDVVINGIRFFLKKSY